jgi:septum site-determining protein MinC
MKQKTLRVVEVDSFEELKKMEKKLLLLKNHFFLLKEKNEEIEEFLKEKGLKYFIENEVVTREVEVVKEVEKIIEVKESKIYKRVIRSGEEIKEEGDVLFVERINPGARVEVKGNVALLGENLGEIRVEGEWFLIKKNSARAIFNEEDIGEINKMTLFMKDFKKVIE